MITILLSLSRILASIQAVIDTVIGRLVAHNG